MDSLLVTRQTRSHEGLDPLALGLAVGLTWAVAVAALGVASRFGWGEGWRDLLADVYLGYERHTAIGVAWGLVDGFAGGYLVAWLYDVFRR